MRAAIRNGEMSTADPVMALGETTQGYVQPARRGRLRNRGLMRRHARAATWNQLLGKFSDWTGLAVLRSSVGSLPLTGRGSGRCFVIVLSKRQSQTRKRADRKVFIDATGNVNPVEDP